MIFRGIQPVFAKKPYDFVIFRGCPDPLSPSGSAHIKRLDTELVKSSLTLHGRTKVVNSIDVSESLTHICLERPFHGTKANRADPDKTLHNTVSDQDLQCLLT